MMEKIFLVIILFSIAIVILTGLIDNSGRK